MSGLPIFQIRASDKFQRSYKELFKRYYKGDQAKQTFRDFVAQIGQDLSEDPFLAGSFSEGWPGDLRLPQEWEFRKYYFDMPNLRGASGQGKPMYLVNRNRGIIQLVWLYTHSEFEKRPPDKSLKQLLQELMDAQSEEAKPSESNDRERLSLSENDE